MANYEEQNTTNEQKEKGNAGADKSKNANNDTTTTGGGNVKDPEHNTGNDRMMIDEEGAEVKPDDQV